MNVGYERNLFTKLESSPIPQRLQAQTSEKGKRCATSSPGFVLVTYVSLHRRGAYWQFLGVQRGVAVEASLHGIDTGCGGPNLSDLPDFRGRVRQLRRQQRWFRRCTAPGGRCMAIRETEDLSEELNAFAAHTRRNEAQIGEIERGGAETGRYLERIVTELGRPTRTCLS